MNSVEKFRLELAAICAGTKTYFENIKIALNSARGYDHPSEVLTEDHYAARRDSCGKD